MGTNETFNKQKNNVCSQYSGVNASRRGRGVGSWDDQEQKVKDRRGGSHRAGLDLGFCRGRDPQWHGAVCDPKVHMLERLLGSPVVGVWERRRRMSTAGALSDGASKRITNSGTWGLVGILNSVLGLIAFLAASHTAGYPSALSPVLVAPS